MHKEKEMRILAIMFQKGYRQIPDQNIDQGASRPPKQYCPLHREETEECVELLDILEITTRKKFY